MLAPEQAHVLKLFECAMAEFKVTIKYMQGVQSRSFWPMGEDLPEGMPVLAEESEEPEGEGYGCQVLGARRRGTTARWGAAVCLFSCECRQRRARGTDCFSTRHKTAGWLPLDSKEDFS